MPNRRAHKPAPRRHQNGIGGSDSTTGINMRRFVPIAVESSVRNDRVRDVSKNIDNTWRTKRNRPLQKETSRVRFGRAFCRYQISARAVPLSTTTTFVRRIRKQKTRQNVSALSGRKHRTTDRESPQLTWISHLRRLESEPAETSPSERACHEGTMEASRQSSALKPSNETNDRTGQLITQARCATNWAGGLTD